MVRFFLRAKHWQLFIILLVLPVFIQLVFFNVIMQDVTKGEDAAPETIISYFLVFPILMLMAVGVLFGWFWSVVVGLNQMIPLELRLNLKRFRIFFFIPFLYILLLVAFLLVAAYEAEQFEEHNLPILFGIMAVIIPLYLFSVFCTFYCIYASSKSLRTAELQREVSATDYIGEFFGVWFFPIGIWAIQPRINKLFKDHTSEFRMGARI